ncbi:MAG: hypothetical protein HFJ54_04940, partial [Clostridia bacterium]|nr:hypothetical protein [Clostridia bacterium]
PNTRLPDYDPGIAISSNEIKSVVFNKSIYYFTGASASISFKTSTAKEMMTKSITSGETLIYFLASRINTCTTTTKNVLNYCIPDFGTNAINVRYLCTTGAFTSDNYNFIRPAVDIPLSGTILGTSRKWTCKYSMDIITRLKIRKVLNA